MFQIPKQERKTYKKNFLKEVIWRIDIDSSEKAPDWEKIKIKIQTGTLQNSIKPEQVKDRIESTFDVTNLVKSGTTNIENIKIEAKRVGLIINSTDRALFITSDFFSYTASNNYPGYEAIQKEFIEIYFSLKDVLPKFKFKSFGIQKHNKVSMNSEEGYRGDGLNSFFFSPLKEGFLSPKSMLTAVNQYTLEEGELKGNIKATCSKIENEKYQLEVVTTIETKKEINDRESFQEVSEEINNKHFSVFSWLLSEDLKQVMEK